VAGRLADRTVARVVQRAARAAGPDAARFGGHSLRAGLATSAAADVDERTIATQTGHRSMAVLRGSIRAGELVRHTAAATRLRASACRSDAPAPARCSRQPHG